jgi:hypothetical protein
MPNPIAVKGVVPAAEKIATEPAGKAGQSRFDQVRDAVRDRQAGAATTLPPTVTSVSPEQKNVLAAELRKKLQQAGSADPQQLFRSDLGKARTGMQNLSARIESMPKTPATDPIRTRLAAIEKQFTDASQLLGKVGSLNSPRELLKVQVEMYQLAQNIEIVSKVVDQVNSGVKQVLQTQVS